MKPDRVATATATMATLQGVLDRLAAETSLSASRRRDLRSAVTCFAKFQDKPAEAIPLDLAAIRGALRVIGVTEALPSFRAQVMAQSWIYILLAIFVPYLYLYNFCASLLGRRLRWRGIEYELISPEQTRVLSNR